MNAGDQFYDVTESSALQWAKRKKYELRNEVKIKLKTQKFLFLKGSGLSDYLRFYLSHFNKSCKMIYDLKQSRTLT